MGGKRRLAKSLLPFFPDHQTYVEPFCGGAGLFFSKEPSRVEVLNDLNGELVNLYRVVRHHLNALLETFEWTLVSREEFDRLKRTDPATLTDIQRAARFLFLQKMAFGAKVTSPTFGIAATSPPRLNLGRLEESLTEARKRLARTYIEHLDWEECIRRYDRPTTFFYLDPPYWKTAGYGTDFPLEAYDRMAALAHSTRGRMMISVNDIPEMHDAFHGLRIDTLETVYTLNGRKQKPAAELVIRNWE